MVATLETALEYAERGWAVFPVRRDKAPATPNGHKDATCDPAEIRALWRNKSPEGVGIATGAIWASSSLTSMRAATTPF